MRHSGGNEPPCCHAMHVDIWGTCDTFCATGFKYLVKFFTTRKCIKSPQHNMKFSPRMPS